VSASGKKPTGGGEQKRRDDLPRRLGDVLTPALDRLATGDEAQAYVAWARAVGDPVAEGTRPKAFRRGQLTVECASSVWAHELTYLGPQILRRMDEVAPGHPVKKFRFVVGRLVSTSPDARDPSPGPAALPLAAPPHTADGEPPGSPGVPRRAGDAGPEGQDSEASAEKHEAQDQRPGPAPDGAARAQAEGVRDERLRAAIEAALRRSSEEPPGASGRGTPSG